MRCFNENKIITVKNMLAGTISCVIITRGKSRGRTQKFFRGMSLSRATMTHFALLLHN